MKTVNKLLNIYSHLGDDVSKELYDARLESMLYQNPYKFLDVVKELNDELHCGEWDDFFREFPKDTPIVFFPAGGNARYMCSLIKKFRPDQNVVSFVDNNKNIYSEGGQSLPIVSLETVRNMYPNAVFFLASGDSVDRIYDQLLLNGVDRKNIFYPKYRNFLAGYGRQYFDLPYLNKVKDEVFIDAGSLDAGTSLEFAKWCDNEYKEIYAFEPNPVSREKCINNVKAWGLERFNMIDRGTYDREDTLRFLSGSDLGAAMIHDAGEETIQVTSIDKVLEGKRATFIKMDVEGSELASLKGAKETIQKYRPKLAISLYHRPEDLIAIPDYILSLVPDYKLYIRHYSTLMFETVCYAI